LSLRHYSILNKRLYKQKTNKTIKISFQSQVTEKRRLFSIILQYMDKLQILFFFVVFIKYQINKLMKKKRLIPEQNN
jgi:hypothetical protein